MLKLLSKSNLRLLNNYFVSSRVLFSSSSSAWSEKDGTEGAKKGNYKVFRDDESPVILDVEEEKAAVKPHSKPEEIWDEFYGINLKRGVTGVFEIEDLVDVLRKNRGQDIFVVKVPDYVNYVDYLVVVTCISKRHIYALTEFVRKVYKKKRLPTDPIPAVLGEGLSDWIALDLGNIALHIMTNSLREIYDLETLWSVGAKFDDLSQKTDNTVVDILEKHNISLNEFVPATQAR